MGTGTNILSEATQFLGDKYQVLWPISELESYIPIALDNLARDIELYWDIKIIEITSGTREYTMPADVVKVARITLDLLLLIKTGLRELQVQSTTWSSDSATPTNYYFDHLSIDKIGLYPNPDTSGTQIAADAEDGIWTEMLSGYTVTIDAEDGIISEIHNATPVSGEWFFMDIEDGTITEYHDESGNLSVFGQTIPNIPANPNQDFILRSLCHVVGLKVAGMALRREGPGQNIEGATLLEGIYASSLLYLNRTFEGL